MIEVKNLTKKYGEHIAVDNLSFKVEKGHIYGFLGPNGAGKSTTMNIITGCLAANEGEVLIDGHDIFEEAEKAKGCIGYLPEIPPIYPDMTPFEYLTFVAQAKKVSKNEIKDDIAAAMELTGITEVSNRLIKNLSKGYKQRVGIAQALLGRPEVIILDEPTVGLDPKQIIEIRDLIKNLGRTHTVILSSHILSEVRAVCDYIIIISNGKMVASDTPDNLERVFAGQSTIALTVKTSKQEAQQALSSVENISNVKIKDNNDGTLNIEIAYEGKEDLREAVFFAFCDIRKPIISMNIAHVSLEDVFIELTSSQTHTEAEPESEIPKESQADNKEASEE